MNRIGWVAAVIGLSLLGFALYHFGGKRGEPVVVRLVPGPPQPRVPPAEAGIDAAALDAAVTYAAGRNTRALVVARGGHIVFEKYWGDTGFDSAVETGFDRVLPVLLVGTALNDRLFGSLDEPLSNYLPESDGATDVGTVRGLLAGDDATLSPEESADLLALVLERAARQPYHELVAQRLWTPLGGGELEFRAAGSQRRRDGVDAGCCLRARIGDWMRVGELLANDGVFEGNQLTPPRYVALAMKPARKDAPRGFFVRVDGHFASGDVAWLEGSGNQRMWIVPSLKLAILRIGDVPPASAGWDESLIPDSIIRGTSGWQPRAAVEGTDPRKYAPH